MDKSKMLYIAKLIGVILSVYLIFKFALPVVAPFVVAYLLALIFDKPVSFLSFKLKMKRIIASIIMIGLLVGVSFLIIYILGCQCMANRSGIEKNILCIKKMLGTQMCKRISESILAKIMDNALPVGSCIIGICGIIVITLIAACLICASLPRLRQNQEKSIFAREIHAVKDNLFGYLAAYVKAQAVILIFTSVVCIAGLYFAGNRYALMLGIIVGVVDAFPLLGSGLVLIPLAIFSAIEKAYLAAAIYVVTFLACYIIRQMLEPKLMGGHLGITSLEALFGLYMGIVLFGLWGFILGPLGYLIIKKIMRMQDSCQKTK